MEGRSSAGGGPRVPGRPRRTAGRPAQDTVTPPAAGAPESVGDPQATENTPPPRRRRSGSTKTKAAAGPSADTTTPDALAEATTQTSGTAPQTNEPVNAEAGEAKASRPSRRRRKAPAGDSSAKDPTAGDSTDGSVKVPEQRETTRAAESAGPPPETEAPAEVAPEATATAEQSPATEDGQPAPRKRRRRGRRGGVKHRQSAEQAVAGIPPLPEPEVALLPEEPEEEEQEEESQEVQGGRPLDGGPPRRSGRQRGKAAPLPTDSDHSATLSFMHPSEREFAHLLEYYGIKYLYEPRSFPLKWEGERVVQMFTPDFYLPEYDQYFELTTMKQSLVTQKNRKLRQVRELYPDINIQLLYRRDLMRLMGKYGFGPLADAGVESSERVLFSEQQVKDRVKELGRQITEDYAGREVVLIGVLRGVVVFMADLMREIDLPMQIEFMEISHYGEEREDSIEVIRDAGTEVLGRDVILVEDIVDTGLTLRYLLEHLKAKKPAGVRVCTLLDKSVRRMADVPLDYVGFEVPDEFVIGYGLDYGGRYRNLGHIGILKPVEPKAVAQR